MTLRNLDRFFFSSLLASVLALSAMAAEPELLLDFERLANPQSGWSEFRLNSTWEGPDQTESRQFALGEATVTVTLTSGVAGTSGYDRTNTNDSFTAFSYRSLYRDGIGRLKVSSEAPMLTISNLPELGPGEMYQVTLWTYDAGFNGGRTYSYYNVSGGGSTLIGSILNITTASGAVFTDLGDFSVTGYFIPVEGTLAFAQTGGDPLTGGSQVNGLRITVVPEPSAYGIILGALIFGIALRRHLRSFSLLQIPAK